MPDVEFLPPEPEPGRPDDAPAPAPRRRPPLWTIALAVAVLVAAAIAYALTRTPARGPVAGGSTPPTVRPTVLPSVPTTRAARTIGDPIEFGPHGSVYAAATGGSSVWALQRRRIVRVTSGGGRQQAPVPTFNQTGPNGAVLVLSPGGHLWVLAVNGLPGKILDYDAFNLGLIRTVPAPGINGVATIGAHLYLTSGNRLYDLAPRRARLRPIGSLGSTAGPVAAVAGTHRLVVVGYGPRAHAWSYDIASGRVTRTRTLAIEDATIASVYGTVWVAGLGERGAVLHRLDPRTLRPAAAAPLAAKLGGAAQVVGTGRSVFWVRASGAGNALYCVDAAGRVDQQWHIGGDVASDAGTAVVVTTSGRVVPLRLHGCAG